MCRHEALIFIHTYAPVWLIDTFRMYMCVGNWSIVYRYVCYVLTRVLGMYTCVMYGCVCCVWIHCVWMRVFCMDTLCMNTCVMYEYIGTNRKQANIHISTHPYTMYSYITHIYIHVCYVWIHCVCVCVLCVIAIHIWFDLTH